MQSVRGATEIGIGGSETEKEIGSVIAREIVTVIVIGSANVSVSVNETESESETENESVSVSVKRREKPSVK